MKALLALEDGRTFPCRCFTGDGEAGGEVVFNTSMTGYQEILTDPSYKGQIVTMTYPLIGNYGVNQQDVESAGIQAEAFIIREYQEFPSNCRMTETLRDYLVSYGKMGIDQLDTRALTRHIRTVGAMRGVISTSDPDPVSLAQKARSIPSMVGQDLVAAVSSDLPYFWKNGQPEPCHADIQGPESVWRNNQYRVVAFDYGIKYNILRSLENAGCEVLVVPAKTTAETVKGLSPDGIFLSNGPGDPEPVDYAVDTIRNLLGYRPIFGICLGIQLIGLALGAKTYKLKFGHHGGNQPVKNLVTGKVDITAQNHGFAVDADYIDPDILEVTHINLNDYTVEGLRHKKYPLFAVQYHPEAAPGPNDATGLFGDFVQMMTRDK